MLYFCSILLEGNNGLPQSLQKMFHSPNFCEFRAVLAYHVQETAKTSASQMSRPKEELSAARTKMEEMRNALIDAEERAEQERRAFDVMLMQLKSEKDELDKKLQRLRETLEEDCRLEVERDARVEEEKVIKKLRLCKCSDGDCRCSHGNIG